MRAIAELCQQMQEQHKAGNCGLRYRDRFFALNVMSNQLLL